ncbi:MAG TPA: DUF4124 domain-containing protein [Lysobacter sp.]
MRRGARRGLAPWLCLLLAVHAAPSPAQVVIYRCTDASGAVTLQNGTPCPKGSRQQKRVMETPPAAPMPVPTPAIVATPAAPTVVAPPPTAPPPEPVAVPAKQPPPALYECRTWDRQRYFGDVAQPPPRCVPVQVTGLDGQAASAGGNACQMMEDACQPVPEPRLCEAWAQRLRDLEARSTFAATSTTAPTDDLARVREVLQGSTCAD